MNMNCLECSQWENLSQQSENFLLAQSENFLLTTGKMTGWKRKIYC